MSKSEHKPSKQEKSAKVSYIWVQKGTSPKPLCPENFKSVESYDQEPKKLPTPPSSRTKKKNRRTKRTSNHILSNNVASTSSQTPESNLDLPVSSNPSASKFLPSNPDNGKPPCLSSSSDDLPKADPLSTKPTISLVSKGKQIWVEKGASPTYSCPENFKKLIKKDIVPEVLKKPLSMSTYKEYFQALLYAEDCYLQKWDGFEMKNVILQLHDATILRRKGKRKALNGDNKEDKTFVGFEIDNIRERRPFLLSRDFITLRPLMNKNKSFQGIIFRVIRSNLVLAEFSKDFYFQHDPFGAYDVKFSFNRVCLKRAHQAILDASENLFRNFLFPKIIAKGPYVHYKVGGDEDKAIKEILTLKGPPPYLVEGPFSLTRKPQLSKTGKFLVKTILQIYRASSSNRILLCAPTNKMCDMFVIGLKYWIPESDMFRANAAFRELDGVPLEILPSCLYETEQECFSCPLLEELCEFKVILSTYMSSFRLHNQGIMAGHFTHIVLVNASSITEPETLVPLTSFCNEETTVIVTGKSGNRSNWIRSTMARENGLKISYFERVRKYRHDDYPDDNTDPLIITNFEGLSI